MDQSLNEEVSRQLLEESPMDTKSDLIIESAEEGTLSLLKKWPDMKEKLQVCLNQPLPTQLRQVAWRLYLSDTKGRKINGFKSDCLMSFHCLSFLTFPQIWRTTSFKKVSKSKIFFLKMHIFNMWICMITSFPYMYSKGLWLRSKSHRDKRF